MCCKLALWPCPPSGLVLRILTTAGFEQREGKEEAAYSPYRWVLQVPEEDAYIMTLRSAYTTLPRQETDYRLEFALYPIVADLATHSGKRIAFSKMLKVADAIAQQAPAPTSITQHRTVYDCTNAVGEKAMSVIARYPDEPMVFERICPGFQAVLSPEVPS